MIPILYEETEKEFKTNGIGRLSDAVSCIVHERKNDSYELDMTYPVDGKYFKELQPGRIIFATHDNSKKPQPFDIVSVISQSHGEVKVTAQHISRRLKGVLTKLNRLWFTTGNTVTAIFDDLNDKTDNGYIIGSCPFVFHTNITDAKYGYSPKVDTFTSVYDHLLDIRYGLLSVENGAGVTGEYEFDTFNVILNKTRGSDDGVKMRTGKNVKTLAVDMNNKNVVSGVLAFWHGNDPIKGVERTITINGDTASVLDENDFGGPADILQSGLLLSYQKVVTLDLSSKFSYPPTPSQIRKEAEFYLEQQKELYTFNSDSYAIDLVYNADNTKELQSADLCDWVMVEDVTLLVQKKLQITEVWYDTLRNRYTSMTVGVLPKTFKQLVHKENAPVNAKADNIQAQVKDLAAKTDVENKVYPTTYDPAHPEKWDSSQSGDLVDAQGNKVEQVATINRRPVFVKTSGGSGSKDSRTWFIVQDSHSSQFMKIYAQWYENNVFTRKQCNLTSIRILQTRFFVGNPREMEQYGREIAANVLLEISSDMKTASVPCTCTLKIKLQNKLDDFRWSYTAEMYNLAGVGESDNQELVMITQQSNKYMFDGTLQIDGGVSQ